MGLRGGVFRKYLISYVSIALMACTVVGMLLLSVSMSEMQHTIRQADAEKRELAAYDVDLQLSELRDTSIALKASAYCQPFYFTRNAVYEMDLIEELRKHDPCSQWDARVYLYYPERGAVFGSGARYAFRHFVQYMVSAGDDADAIGCAIESLIAVSGGVVTLGDGGLLIVYPIFYSSDAQTRERAYALFHVQTAQIIRRAAISAALDEELITFSQEQVQNGHTIATLGPYTLRQMDTVTAYDRLHEMQLRSWMLILVACGAFLCAAVLLAWLNYRPLYRLTQRYAPKGERAANEIDLLNHTLADAIDESRINRRELAEKIMNMDMQKRQFRQQMLMLLLAGRYDDGGEGDALLKDVDIHLPGPFFAVLPLSIAGNAPFEVLECIVAELSDESIAFLSVQLPDGVAVITSLAEKDTAAVAADMLENAAKASGIELRAHTGIVCEKLTQLPISFMSALPGLQVFQQGERVHWYDEGQLNQLLQCVAEGGIDAPQKMRDLVHVIDRRCPSVAMRRCAYMDVFNCLVKRALDEGVPVSDEYFTQVLIASDAESFALMVEPFLRELTSVSARGDDQREEMRSRMMDYLSEHVCDIDFNIERLAEAFGMSAKRAARMMKTATGEGYKEQVIRLRMKEACRLLACTDEPISGMHLRVGYSSASHFIKTFKETMGITPSSYRVLNRKQ